MKLLVPWQVAELGLGPREPDPGACALNDSIDGLTGLLCLRQSWESVHRSRGQPRAP